MTFRGHDGDDDLTGTPGNDTFNLTQGGDDTAHGGDGNDTFWLGATLTAADTIDGGTGDDKITLNGDYSAGLVLGATTITGIERLFLAGGHSYNLTTNDANVAAGEKLVVNAASLGARDTLVFDGSAELDGHFNIFAGAGDDTIAGGAKSDTVHFDKGGEDTFHGGDGRDTIYMGASLDSGDRIDGGTGQDTLVLNGHEGDQVVFDADTMTGIDVLQLASAASAYSLVTDDGNVAAGAVLTVDLSTLAASDSVTFDGSAELDGAFRFVAGANLFTDLTGGANADTFDMRGADASASTTLNGGGGNDTFVFAGNFDSASQSVDGGTGQNKLVLDGDYSAVSLFGGLVQNIQTVILGGGHSYDNVLVFNAVSGSGLLTINATNLLAGDALSLDAVSSTESLFVVAGQEADTILGSALSDSFFLRTSFNAADSIDGGGGNDTVSIQGPGYGSGVGSPFAISATMMTNVETLLLEGQNNYYLQTADGVVASGKTLTVDFQAIGAGRVFNFDGSAETDGSFQFNAGASFTASDSIKGGAKSDYIALDGDYSSQLSITSTMLSNVENITVFDGHSYNLKLSGDAVVAAGKSLTVDASLLQGANRLTFDGSSETDGSFTIYTGAGDDNITGGGMADQINLKGGIDTVHAGGGDDAVLAGAFLTAADTIDGGAGTLDQLTLVGDYTGANALVLGAATITNVEYLTLGSGHSYDITTNDATVASGQSLLVNAIGLTAFDALTFDGSAETDGRFQIVAGAGDDVIKGSGGGDDLDFSMGGNDSFTGGSGGDTIEMDAALSAGDAIDGGGGNDLLTLSGDYSGARALVFGAATVTNIETISLTFGGHYDLTTDDATVAAGRTLTVTANALGAGDSLILDGSAETNGAFAVTGGAGDDIVKLGTAATLSANAFNGGAGSDTLEIGGTFAAFTSLILSSLKFSSIETLQLDGAVNLFRLDILGDIAGGATLTVDAAAKADGITLDLGNATSTGYQITFGAGDDLVELANLHASDALDGGTGDNDTLNLSGGAYSGFTFGAHNLDNFEALFLSNGSNYNLTTIDGNVAAGQTLDVRGANLVGRSLTFDGSAETDGSFTIKSGTGDDVLTGGALADTFDLSRGGNDTAKGGGGDDTFLMGAAMTAADTIDGGAGGNNTIVLDGDYSALTLAGSAISNIHQVNFTAGHDYTGIVLTGDITSGSGGLTLEASGLQAGNDLAVDGSQATSGFFLDAGGDGSVSAIGSDFNDTFFMGARFSGDDAIDGGAGFDTLYLDGDYAGLSVTSAMLKNVDQIVFFFEHSYNLTLADDAVVTSSMTIDGGGLQAGDTLTFDGSAETGSSFTIHTGAGDDTVTGGGQADQINLYNGGNDTAHGGGGNDTFLIHGALTAADSIDGGAGSDTLELDGDYSAGVTFLAATMTSIETLKFDAGHDYAITTNDGNVAVGPSLSVNASALGAADTLSFDGRAETNGTFAVTGGAGDDTVKFGSTAQSSSFNGGAGNDTLEIGGAFAAFTNLYVQFTQVTNVENVILDDSTGMTQLTILGDVSGGAALNIDTTAEKDGIGLGVFFGTALVHALLGAGADTVSVQSLHTGDTFDAGGGSDTMALSSDFFNGYTFGAHNLDNFETLFLGSGSTYNLTTVDGNVAAGKTLSVDASHVIATTLTFNGAAELDGSFAIVAGGNNDVLTGGAQADTFDLTLGGTDTVHGGGGDDTFTLGAALTASDAIDGGTGTDTMELNGDYGGLTLGASTISGIETLKFDAGHSYNFTSNDGNVAAGQTLTVDASALGSANAATFNGTAETDGAFAFIGGAGVDFLRGGANADSFDMTRGGNDQVIGNGGNDTFNFGSTFDSSDDIQGGAGNDTVNLAASGTMTVSFNDGAVANVEDFVLQNTGSYNLSYALNDFATAVTIDGSALTGGNTLTFVGTATLGATFDIIGGGGRRRAHRRGQQ